MIRLSLRDNRVPVVSGRSTDLSSAVEQFVWSINGSADVRFFQKNTLDDHQKQVSEAHTVPHGFQWRHFGLDPEGARADCSTKGVDQLEKLIDDIRQNPDDRRLVLISWNPLHYLNAEATPTHRIAQFYVSDGELSCKFYHKPSSFENDVVSDIISYSLLTHLIAHTCDLKAVELVHTAGVLDEPQLKQQEQFMIDYAKSALIFPTVQFAKKFCPTDTYLSEDIRIVAPSQQTPIMIEASQGDKKSNGQVQQQGCALEEYKYFDLIRTILDNGRSKADRTGTGTISYFGPELKFNLAHETIPLLTTKRVFWRGVVEELLWFIKGSTDSSLLKDKGVHIWDGNGSKEFLEKIGLGHREEGDLGPVYGFQWRHIGAKYESKNKSYRSQGLDQLKHIIDTIKTKNNQHSTGEKPLVLSAWNPVDIPIMALPPCHCLAEFTIHDDRLSCLMYQRSADVGLGVPFNIASYALLTHMIANITNLKAHELVYTLGDAHIYKDHIEPLKEQLKRAPAHFPKVNFSRRFEDIDNINYEDIELIGYKPQAMISMKMSV